MAAFQICFMAFAINVGDRHGSRSAWFLDGKTSILVITDFYQCKIMPKGNAD